MRCRSVVRSPWALSYRSDPNPDPRCRRHGRFNGRCYQHASVHDRIVQRILSIPPRP